MQQTRLDLWLRKKYAYQTQVSTYRLPEELPEGFHQQAEVTEREQVSNKDYRYLLTFKKEEEAEAFISTLRKQNMLFSSCIIEREGALAQFLCKRERSLTYFLIWRAAMALLIMTVGIQLVLYLAKPETREMIQSAWEEFRKYT